MRFFVTAVVVLLGFGTQASAQGTCTGLCLQQVSCPAGATTSISGVVYAPNGVDPLPNVQIYVPNAAVPAFTPGVTCDIAGAPQPGSPLVGTTSAVDGSFTIPNMPVGTNIPLVIVSGRWRRQLVIPNVSSCTNTALPSTPGQASAFVRFPASQAEGDIPKIAIATGAVDAVECVLRRTGINDSEFTDATGNGRINLFVGDGSTGSGGARISTSTPAESALMGNSSTLSQYDLVMLPCEGGNYPRSSTALANLVNFANAGGRVYSTHFSYAWLYNNPPFNKVANWAINQSSPRPDPGVATVNTTFSGGQTLAQWLQLVGATTTPGQMTISTLRQDTKGVIAPTVSWLNLNDLAAGNPVMQMVFDTPILPTGTIGNQCGRVLFNEYHVENVTSSSGQTFPTECSTAPMNPQEKLLEYSLFELTNDGGGATLAPTTLDFGTVALGFSSPAQTFTWTNNSTFAASVTGLTASGDFAVQGNNCIGVPGGTSCAINVVFSPTVLGARTGTLTVVSNGTTLTSALTGTGAPGAGLTPSTMDFGLAPVGFSGSVHTFTWTNNASAPQSVSSLSATGDFSIVSNNCTAVAAGASCQINMVLTPTAVGTRTGTLTVNAVATSLTASLTGTGVPAITLTPATINFGNVDVGASVTQTGTLSNVAPGTLPVPPLITFGDYTASTAACGGAISANSSCAVTITFKPTTTGARPGSISIQSASAGSPTTLSGNGIDFTFSASPSSGTVVAGLNQSTVVTTSPIAGFANPITLTCGTPAAGSKCTLSATSLTPSSPVTTNVAITTTSQYTVIGYTGSIGGTGWLSLIGVGTGLVLWMRRRAAGRLLRSGLALVLMTVMLGAAMVGMSGCSGKLPAKNPVYTAPGTYTYTITASDGFLVHSATYNLTVTAQ